MLPLQVDSVGESFEEIIGVMLEHGHVVSSRGYSTVEITNLSVHSCDPSNYQVWEEGDQRLKALRAEIDTVRSGDKPSWIADRELDDRLDLDNGMFYEDIIRERISEDWDEWVQLLRDDEGTRKAVSLFGTSVDSPCTSRVQWMIRDGRLNCYSYNRSQEMLFAFPMDMGLFEHYQVQLALELNVELGCHEHTMTSAHIYEEQLDDAEEIVTDLSNPTEIEVN